MFVPVLAHRFARERLKALAQAEGMMVKEQPEVLFVCVHNAGRSQMAAGLVKLRSDGRIHVRSAGSAPASEVNPAVVEAMTEIGVDMSEEFPKPLTDEVVRAADVVITMGCGDACPIYPGKRYEDWDARRPRRPGPRGGARHPRRDRCPRAGPDRPIAWLSPPLARRCARGGRSATFSLVFAGCGAIIVDSERGGSLGAVGISAVFGLVIMAMIYATGHLSGAHINPAVTIAFAVTRHFPIRDAAAYIPAQLGGAAAGAASYDSHGTATPAHLGATTADRGLRLGASLRDRPHRIPDVRDRRRRHRQSRCRPSSRDRNRGHRGIWTRSSAAASPAPR